MSARNKTKPTANPTSSEIINDEAPSAGSLDEVQAIENPQIDEAQSDSLENIADISADINADIIEASKKEAKQLKEDEKNSAFFEENESDFIEKLDEGLERGKNKILYGVLAIASLGGLFYLFINKMKKENKPDLQEQLNNGARSTIQTDQNGMIINDRK